MNTESGLLRQTWPVSPALAFGLGVLRVFGDKLIIALCWLATWTACIRFTITRNYF